MNILRELYTVHRLILSVLLLIGIIALASNLTVTPAPAPAPVCVSR